MRFVQVVLWEEGHSKQHGLEKEAPPMIAQLLYPVFGYNSVNIGFCISFISMPDWPTQLNGMRSTTYFASLPSNLLVCSLDSFSGGNPSAQRSP